MKAMIFAAGLGTRLRPITEKCPKALVEIGGYTLLELVIRKLKHFGFDEIIINVHHFANQIVDFLAAKHNFGIHIEISDETDLLLDTGGGLKKAAHFFADGKPFLVHNVDILSDINLLNLYNAHLQHNSLATLAVRKRDGSRFFLFNNELHLCGWANFATGEKRLCTTAENELFPLAFSGIHVVEPRIFDSISENGVFSIVDVYLRLANNNKIKAYSHDSSSWNDVGKTENLQLEVSKFVYW